MRYSSNNTLLLNVTKNERKTGKTHINYIYHQRLYFHVKNKDIVGFMKKIFITAIAFALLLLQITLMTTPILGRCEYSCAFQNADDETYDGFAPIQYGSISGSVYGENDWMIFPLVGAKVEAGGKIDYTDIFGNYIIDDLPVGHTYSVVASKIGYENKDLQVTITLSSPIGIAHFTLQRSGASGGKTSSIQNVMCEGYTEDPICGGEY